MSERKDTAILIENLIEFKRSEEPVFEEDDEEFENVMGEENEWWNDETYEVEEENNEEIEEEGENEIINSELFTNLVKRVRSEMEEIYERYARTGLSVNIETYLTMAASSWNKMAEDKSKGSLNTMKENYSKLMLDYWRIKKEWALKKAFILSAEQVHDGFVGVANRMATSFKQRNFYEEFKEMSIKENIVINDETILDRTKNLMPDLVYISIKNKKIHLIEVKGTGIISDSTKKGIKYERIRDFAISEGYEYRFLLLESRNYSTWSINMEQVMGVEKILVHGEEDVKMLEKYKKGLSMIASDYPSVVVEGNVDKETKMELSDIIKGIPKFNKHIRGYSDSVGKAWTNRYKTIQDLAQDVEKILDKMPEEFDKTEHVTVKEAFNTVWENNDRHERIKKDEEKPMMACNMTKNVMKVKESMISQIRNCGTNSSKGIEELKKLFNTRKTWIDAEKKSQDGLVLNKGKNKINVSESSAIRQSKIIKKFVDACKDDNEKKAIKTLSREMCEEENENIEAIRTLMEEEIGEPIQLKKGAKTINSIGEEVEEEIEAEGDKLMDHLLRTRGMKLVSGLASMANGVLINQSAENKKFCVYDGGSGDILFLTRPRGLSSNSNTQVVYCVITRGKTVKTFNRVLSTEILNGEQVNVSYPISADPGRMNMYRNSFLGVLSYSMTQGLSIEGSFDEKLRYAKKCMSYGVMCATSPHQGFSLVTDLYKYMINASLSEYSLIKALVTKKAKIMVKSYEVGYQLNETERWMIELIQCRDKIIKTDVLIGNEDEIETTTGIKGTFPSMTDKGRNINSLRCLINEVNGINMLRGKGLYGHQEIAKAYSSIKEMDIIYDKDLKEIGAERMMDGPLEDFLERRLGQLSRSVIELGTTEFFKNFKNLSTEQGKTLLAKGLEKSILTISSMNGTVNKEGDGSSTSITDALDILTEQNLEGTYSIIDLARDAAELETVMRIAEKEQRGGPREITSISTYIKGLFRVIEMCEQSLGDHVPGNIITGKHKLTGIQKAWQKVFRSPDLPKGKIWIASEDNQKWSNSMESTNMLYYMRNSPLYKNNESLMNAAELSIGKNFGRKIMIKHKIADVPKDYNGEDREAWEYVAHCNRNKVHMEAKTGWPQGMFNNLSTNIKTVSCWLINEVSKILIRKDFVVEGVEHSDDSIFFAKGTEEEVLKYCKIRYLIWRCFGIKKSDTKSSLGTIQGEMVSNHIINGEVCNPFIKAAVTMSADFSCKGPAEDTIDALNRVTNVIREGASMEIAIQLKKICMHKIYMLYSHGEGMKNDPEKIIKELTGLRIPRYMIPLTLFGSPGVSVTEMIVTRSVGDDLIKIRNLVNLKKSKLDEKRCEILEKLLCFSYKITPIGTDRNQINSRCFGSLKFAFTGKKKDKLVKYFSTRLREFDSSTAFPLWVPTKNVRLQLNFMKDLSEHNSYKDALAKVSDSISNQRKLAMLVRGKSLMIKEHRYSKEEENLTDNEIVNKARNNAESFTLETILANIVNNFGGIVRGGTLNEITKDMVNFASTFTVYNGLIEYVNTFKMTDSIKVKGPYVINKGDRLVNRIAEPKTIIKCLYNIYNKRECEEEMGQLTDEEIIVKNYILDRFGNTLADLENKSNFMKVHKILMDEVTSTTPFIQPKIRGRRYADYIRNMISVIAFTNKEVGIISGVRLKLGSSMTDDNIGLGAQTQCILGSITNGCNYRLRDMIEEKQLDEKFIMGNRRLKLQAAMYKKIIYNKSDLLYILRDDTDGVKHEYLRKQILRNRKYTGWMVLKIEHGETIMVFKRYDSYYGGDLNDGLSEVRVKNFNQNSVSRILKFYLEKMEGRMKNNEQKDFFDNRYLWLSANAHKNKNWTSRLVEFAPRVVSLTPSKGVQFDKNLPIILDDMLSRVSIEREGYGDWEIDYQKLIITFNGKRVWAVPRFDYGLSYLNCEIVVKQGAMEIVLDNPSDVSGFLENNAGLLTHETVRLAMTWRTEEMITDFALKFFKMFESGPKPVELTSDLGRVIEVRDWEYHLSGYNRYVTNLGMLCSDGNIRLYNIDNILASLEFLKMRTKKKYIEMVRELCKRKEGWSMICTCVNGNIVSRFYNKLYNSTENKYELKGRDKDGHVTCDLMLQSTAEYLIVNNVEEERQANLSDIEESIRESREVTEVSNAINLTGTELEYDENIDYDMSDFAD